MDRKHSLTKNNCANLLARAVGVYNMNRTYNIVPKVAWSDAILKVITPELQK